MIDLNTMLEAERTRLETEQADLQEQVRKGADRLTQIKGRLEHILALLGKEGAAVKRGEDSQLPSSQGNNTPLNVCNLAVEILGERNGEPMYYKNLAQEVVSRGGILKGATPWANLTAADGPGRAVRPPHCKGLLCAPQGLSHCTKRRGQAEG